MDVLECIAKRRSVRAYCPNPVPEEAIRTVVDAGLWAPSASNRRELVYAVISGQAEVRRLRAFAPGMIGHPPVVLVVACDKSRIPHTLGTGEIGREAHMDAAMAVQNMLLGATALGLGCCVIASFHAPSVARLLGFPDSVVPVLLVSLGYPEHVPDPPPRLPLSEVLHWGCYGRRAPATSDGSGGAEFPCV